MLVYAFLIRGLRLMQGGGGGATANTAFLDFSVPAGIGTRGQGSDGGASFPQPLGGCGGGGGGAGILTSIVCVCVCVCVCVVVCVYLCLCLCVSVSVSVCMCVLAHAVFPFHFFLSVLICFSSLLCLHFPLQGVLVGFEWT